MRVMPSAYGGIDSFAAVEAPFCSDYVVEALVPLHAGPRGPALSFLSKSFVDIAAAAAIGLRDVDSVEIEPIDSHCLAVRNTPKIDLDDHH